MTTACDKQKQRNKLRQKQSSKKSGNKGLRKQLKARDTKRERERQRRSTLIAGKVIAYEVCGTKAIFIIKKSKINIQILHLKELLLKKKLL